MDNNFEKLAKLIRYNILLATTTAGSGHVTSALSAVELATVLFFKHFRYDLDNPKNPANDKLIFSKGHATPLFYSLFAAAGVLSEEEIKSYRKFDSALEGHPMMRFPHTIAPTGSLGQGLSVGEGVSLNDKYLELLDTRTYVLMGDGEIAEGQVWEAIQTAGHYKLNNLIALLDINRLGQTGATMIGHDISIYEERLKGFGWRTYLVEDGHDLEEVDKAYKTAIVWSKEGGKPVAIIARTVKGKGVSFLHDKDNWHGKALSKDEFTKAVDELGEIDKKIKGVVRKPDVNKLQISNHPDGEQIPYRAGKLQTNCKFQITPMENKFPTGQANYKLGEKIATRKAYGNGLVSLGKAHRDVVALDGDVGNSTYAEKFAIEFPERFFEMFIAEQNMVSVALGLATCGKVPFVSTFAAFLTRAHDQIRMADLSGKHIVFCGSHAGVSIGEDGPSQMGLDDISMIRGLLNTTVLYPCDAVSTEKSIGIAYKAGELVYIRTTRGETPVIYKANEDFVIGGSKTLKSSENDLVTVVAAGITVHEALKAYRLLKNEGISARVVDCYSIKPIDEKTLEKAAADTKAIITVEDHYLSGGLGDAVLEALAQTPTLAFKLGVSKLPRSGKPDELLSYEGISADTIAEKVKEVVKEVVR